jgi:hypothetical protein
MSSPGELSPEPVAPSTRASAARIHPRSSARVRPHDRSSGGTPSRKGTPRTTRRRAGARPAAVARVPFGGTHRPRNGMLVAQRSCPMPSPLRAVLALCAWAFASTGVLPGCTSYGSTVPLAEQEPSPAPQVAVFAASEPPRSYVIVGFVSASAHDEAHLVGQLKRQAASLGATAVIGLRVTMTQRSWIQGTAVAVRWS